MSIGPRWLARIRRDVAAKIAAHAHQRAVLAHAKDMLDMNNANLRRIQREVAELEAKVKRPRD